MHPQTIAIKKQINLNTNNRSKKNYKNLRHIHTHTYTFILQMNRCVHVNIYMNTRIPDFLVKNNENIVLIDIKIIIFNQKN